MYPLPKSIIFDLDGTMLNTIADLAASCNHALSELGQPTHPTDAYFYFVGNGITTLARRILPENARTPGNITRCVSLISDHYDHSWHNKTTVYPGIKELLHSLQAKDIAINVLSNKNETTVQKMVAYFLGDFHFQYTFGAVSDFAKKPDPGRALYLAQKLSLAPSEIMFIGDSKVDMQTAGNAGMISVGVTWGFRSRQELIDHDAHIIIDSPMDFWQEID